MKNTTKGFTLIELLVVIAIIGLLSSVVLASLSTARAKSKAARVAADVHSMDLALQMMYDDLGCWPGEGANWPISVEAGTCVATSTSNPTLKSLIASKTWGMDKYLSSGSAYPFDNGAEWAYDNDGDTWAGDCSAYNAGGLNLTLMKGGSLHLITLDEYKLIEKAIDSTPDASLMSNAARFCGKMQWVDGGAGVGNILIRIARP